MRIRDADDYDSLWHTIVGDTSQCASIEALAQRFTHRFYDYFVESTVLVRTFATLRCERLPEHERAFVGAIAAQADSAQELTDATDVLTLLGTRGARPQWNARSESRGHLAIPLLSEAFVGEIPMIARMLGETGFVPLFGGRARSQYVTRAGEGADGLFFVGDARMTTDERGRLIIPAADFVEEHGVKTVFGFGGSYPSAHTFVTTIVFCRESIARQTASNFTTLGRDFKAHSEDLLRRDAVFA
jgi:hypothetical protein